MKPLILMLVLLGAARAACFPIRGSRILGRNLAEAEPGFAGLPATLMLGYAPAPGNSRVFAVAELLRIARGNSIPFVPVGDICFDLPMRKVTEDEAMAAIRKSLPREATVKLIELQKILVPEGELEFPIAGLQPAGPLAGRVRLWRGSVRYSDTQKAPFWARVEITAPLLRHTGPEGIDAESAGVEIRRGDAVRVEVECGRTRLLLDAVALTGARAGELVDLRNPSSGKSFKARVVTGSLARVVLSDGQTL